jgi:hypothetical protein
LSYYEQKGGADGNRVELMEIAPDGLQAQAISRLREGRPPQA